MIKGDCREFMEDMIKKCLRKLKGDSFDYEEALVTGGYLSSFDMVELVVMLEELTEVTIPSERISPEALDSIKSITSLLGSLKRGD